MRGKPIVLATAVIVAVAAAVTPSATGAKPQAAPDKGTTDRYVVIMAADPVVSYDGDVRGLPATKPAKGKKVDHRAAPVQRYVDYLENQHTTALRDAGVPRSDVTAEYSFALNGFAAKLTRGEADVIAHQDGVVAVLKDQMQQPQTDSSPQFLGLTDKGGAYDRGVTGKGVVAGIIDTGIWPEHPSFADNGTYPAPPAGFAVPCELGNPGYNPDDKPFTCNNKLLGARDMRTTYNDVIGPELYDSARDAEGHGTHTASTAAGNSGVKAEIFDISRGKVSGIAPRAQVIAYKVCGDQGCFDSDTAAAINQAVADGVDVINYSIGGGAGLIGADELAFLFAANAGVFVATSAGNSGPGAGTIGGPSSAPWVTSVAASTQDRVFQGSVVLGNGRRYSGPSVTPGTGTLRFVDAAAAGNELCLLDQQFTASVAGAIVLCKRGSNARVDKSHAVLNAGGAGMVLYDLSNNVTLLSDNHWVPSVHINNSDGLAVKAYLTAAGSSAKARITAGEKKNGQGNLMADFSSRGPNPAALDIIKPDITAPGVRILAGNSPAPGIVAASDPSGELFQAIAGTSMSSPHMAGIYALIKQAHPDWSAAMAKSAAMTTARQNVLKENKSTKADPFDFGAGHVKPGGKIKQGSMFEPGLVYDAGINDYFAFLCGTAPEIFANPTATCGSLQQAGFSLDPSDLNYPSIGVAQVAGTQTVTRKVTSVAKDNSKVTYKPKVVAPAGFKVTVSPSSITLRRGQSATYKVTITNNGSAPLGQWRFGSLTWESRDGYEVRSPIAVAASAFDAPAQVDGSGTSGTASFPVKFGYTGPYDAEAHGLVARTDVPGSVGQDPDQTFDPTNPAGTTAHQFTVSGSTYLRWRLTHPTAAVDLDVYLYNSAGQLIASSTNGGTDELIELRLPANDTYTLYVHGWQTLNVTQNYTLGFWNVPSSTGGSLAITSEPADAVIGQTGTVGVSWSGLAAGQEYFGAVAHNRDTTSLGITLVHVTTG
ncbi:MAG TPA: S8 family serine peptidase [Kribbella sp.]|uniref:S8 family serine peptidase n=1 Tax=Kribbella sp. TaxID=1871183 RepID=UPI002D7766CA|nr:S8 family serine peptidase [Kribbella sp.]HET6297035.1 S8 family serine peptidase [Kribbella sp.]